MSPSPFIVEWVERIARDRGAGLRALDVAMGSGRHAVAMARAGLRTFGVDVKLSAVREAQEAARCAGVRINGWCADLRQHPLPRGRFDLVVVARYLQRDLFPALRGALAPGGVVIYETFTTSQRALGRPPTSPDHLLEPSELRRHFDGFDVLCYEELFAPDAVARLAARSRS
jgi:2-polyprenyl-3-methyl-5-hydroxy-6-metoxy-1,4-benzoquinol methylase